MLAPRSPPAQVGEKQPIHTLLEELQDLIHEVLALMVEYQQTHPPNNLLILRPLLHLMTDLETDLVLTLGTLKSERLIYNDLILPESNVVEDEP